jgi:hypothetical protein
MQVKQDIFRETLRPQVEAKLYFGTSAAESSMSNPHPAPYSLLLDGKVKPCACTYCVMVRRSAPTRNDSPK